MNTKCLENAQIFKALGDPNRLYIIDMLSGGELCACKILENFDITQPTLSHHMKILCDAGIVNYKREGKWMYYSLNIESLQKINHFFSEVALKTENVCKKPVIGND